MDAYAALLKQLKEEGNFRTIPHQPEATAGGVIDLSSNDYLGLASRTEFQEEFFSQPGALGLPMTSSASRLLAGRQSEYEKLESQLRELYGREILLFNSGYHANTGAVSALAQADRTLIVADKLVHASIIDGMTLSHAPFTRFRHNDMAHLERILAKESASHDRLMVVVESIYSMDGDHAPLDELIRLKRLYPKAMLYVDEAHALGVEGDRGLGLCRSTNGYDEIDVIIGTFGKACASMGAFAAVNSEIYHYLVNRSRSLIFSTALPPITIAWTSFMMDKIVGMDRERSHLRSLGEQLSGMIRPLVSNPTQITPSHILPFVTGDPVKAVSLSHALLNDGFKVLPIRRPTVPPGTDRLRISLSASLTHNDIKRFGEALKRRITI